MESKERKIQQLIIALREYREKTIYEILKVDLLIDQANGILKRLKGGHNGKSNQSIL